MTRHLGTERQRHWCCHCGLSGKGGHDAHYSSEELKLILRTSQPGEKFTRDERNILAQSLDFEQMTVSDLMRPINEVIALHASNTLEENLDTVLRNRFSRYPYFDTKKRRARCRAPQGSVLCHTAVKPITSPRGSCSVTSFRAHAALRCSAASATAPRTRPDRRKRQTPAGFIRSKPARRPVGEIRDEFRRNETTLKQSDGTLIGKASLPSSRSNASSASIIENRGAGRTTWNRGRLDMVSSVTSRSRPAHHLCRLRHRRSRSERAPHRAH